ncbi:unnamed protein product [Leptosia nina]|uniref:Uncharacterized protein n=1 Tax=Leptosia nina TaxID=320188 RepID=A0AAV1K1I5_9NEOP
MSKPKLDSDGFQIVSSKKSAKIKSTKIPRQPEEFLHEYRLDPEKSYLQILSALEVLKDSQYLKDLIKSV